MEHLPKMGDTQSRCKSSVAAVGDQAEFQDYSKLSEVLRATARSPSKYPLSLEPHGKLTQNRVLKCSPSMLTA